MKPTTATLTIVAFTAAMAPTSILAQTRDLRSAVEFCVTPPDSNWRPANIGFDTDNELRILKSGVREFAYPVIRNVQRGSAADSAGIREGDVWRAVDHHDFKRERALAKTHGPGVPVVVTIARGDSVFERRLTPAPVKPSRCSK